MDGGGGTYVTRIINVDGLGYRVGAAQFQETGDMSNTQRRVRRVEEVFVARGGRKG